MSEVVEEAMDSSAVSDEDTEDQRETSQDDQSGQNKSFSKISGKRKECDLFAWKIKRRFEVNPAVFAQVILLYFGC